MFNIRHQEQAIASTQRRLADERDAFCVRTDSARANIRDALQRKAILAALKKGISISRARLTSSRDDAAPKQSKLRKVRKTIVVASVALLAWQLLSNRDDQ